MHKFLVRIMCCFIPSRKKRHEVWHDFKVKHGYIAPDYIKNLENKIVELQNTQKHFDNQTSAEKNNINEINTTIIGIKKDTEILFGIKEFINRNVEKKLSTALLHQKTFSQFKGINTGKDIVILATGPSLNKFKPIKNAIYIGVNSALKYNKVKFDYLFAQDYLGLHDYINEMNSYDCIKFYGLTTEYDGEWKRVIPESQAIKANALRYRTDWENHEQFGCRFAYDLSSMSLGCFGSIVFPAIQFALWTNPKRIYLVGCDCSNAGHFDSTKAENLEYLIEPWKKLKQFVSIYYPETEIISVNPVGLRGLFKDLDQKD